MAAVCVQVAVNGKRLLLDLLHTTGLDALFQHLPS